MACEMEESECVIIFDQNEYGTYFAGELVSGKVIITSTRPRTLTAIKLELCGLSRCAWKKKFGKTQPAHHTSPPSKHIHIGSEDYFHWTTYLIGHKYGQSFKIPASILSYNFAFQLPQNCPASFEGKYGFVRYMIKISFIRSGAFDRTRMVGLTILPLLDLNRESALLKTPITSDLTEKTCLMRNDAVSLSVTLPRSAFAIGELIPVTVHIRNLSKSDCKYLVIKLNLCAKYTSDEWQSITENITLVERKCSAVQAHQHKTFLEPLRVPAAPPTSEHLSKAVRISYEILVEAKMSTFLNKILTKTPITIGNVPYHNTNRNAEENTIVIDNEAANASASFGSRVSMSLSNESSSNERDWSQPELPPSYEEAIFMRADIAEDVTNEVIRSTIFIPHYPVFNVHPENGLATANSEKATTKKKHKKRKQIKFNVEESFDERLV